MPNPFRIGIGYDIHRFAPGRRLVLGGVEIEADFGLLGHSDADVLIHALADAILGAVGCPDIGHFFPPGDKACAGLDSREILKRAALEARERGYILGNADVTLIAEKPKIGPHVAAMRRKIAETLAVDEDLIGIKATSNEGLGALGRAEGIAAHAAVLMRRI